jgi:hypothetical protein
MPEIITQNDAGFVVFNCSRSWPENHQFRLFYNNHPMGRAAKYIGFYQNMAVRVIGVLEKAVFVNRTKNGLHVIGGGALTPEEEKRINGSMDSAKRNRDWNVTCDQCFFLASSVEETLFKKEKYAFRGNRKYFDLREVSGLNATGKMPELSILASKLGNVEWK